MEWFQDLAKMIGISPTLLGTIGAITSIAGFWLLVASIVKRISEGKGIRITAIEPLSIHPDGYSGDWPTGVYLAPKIGVSSSRSEITVTAVSIEDLHDPNDPSLLNPSVSLLPAPGRPFTETTRVGAGSTEVLERRVPLRLLAERENGPEHLLRRLDDYKPITIRLRVNFLRGGKADSIAQTFEVDHIRFRDSLEWHIKEEDRKRNLGG